jgi:hypothetical protein
MRAPDVPICACCRRLTMDVTGARSVRPDAPYGRDPCGSFVDEHAPNLRVFYRTEGP